MTAVSVEDWNRGQTRGLRVAWSWGLRNWREVNSDPKLNRGITDSLQEKHMIRIAAIVGAILILSVSVTLLHKIIIKT